MDDLGKKLKSLSNPFKTKFKGQGQKLGGGDGDEDGEAAKPKVPGGVPRTGPAAARNLLNQRLQQVTVQYLATLSQSLHIYTMRESNYLAGNLITHNMLGSDFHSLLGWVVEEVSLS